MKEMELHRDMLVDDEDDREINVDTDSRCSGTADEESCGSRTSSIIDGVDDVQIRSCSATGSDGGGSNLSPGCEHNHLDPSSPHPKLEDRGGFLSQHLHARKSIGRLDDDRRSLTPSPPPSTTSNASSGTLSSRQALPFSISRLLGSDFEANNNSVNGGRQEGNSLEKGTDNIATSMLLHSQERGISQHEAITSLYTHPAIVQLSGSGGRTNVSGGLCPVSAGLAAAGLVYSTAAGVIRVPAHRPPPPPPLGAPSGAAGNAVPPLAAPFPWLAAASMDATSLQRSAAAAAFASQVVKERLTGNNFISRHAGLQTSWIIIRYSGRVNAPVFIRVNYYLEVSALRSI